MNGVWKKLSIEEQELLSTFYRELTSIAQENKHQPLVVTLEKLKQYVHNFKIKYTGLSKLVMADIQEEEQSIDTKLAQAKGQ